MKIKRTLLCIVAVVTLSLPLCNFACNAKTTKNLAIASDAIAHALADGQGALKQGCAQNIVDNQTCSQVKEYFSQAATAGLALDQSIRAGETATNVSQKANLFFDAFNNLQNQGLVGIKDPATKLAISTAINGAEASLAVISAYTGK